MNTLSRHLTRTQSVKWVGWLVLVLALLALLGCSRLETATRPAGPSTINAGTDTTTKGRVPTVEEDGTTTEPVERTIIRDTVRQVGVSVQRFSVDRRPDIGQIRVLWRRADTTIEDTWPIPAYGEWWVWKGRTQRRVKVDSTPASQRGRSPVRKDTVLRRDTVRVGSPIAEVIGSPQPQEVEVTRKSVQMPWYQKLWVWVRIGLSFVIGAIVTYVIVKLVPGL